MEKNRLEAFSDGVFAIIITIMVLELRPPEGSSFKELIGLNHKFISYLLSYLYIGIYWSNHHHLLSAVKKINGKVLIFNLNLLFWVSLFPFATDWVGESNMARDPVLLYGLILFISAISYVFLTKSLASITHEENVLIQALSGYKKEFMTLTIYFGTLILSFFYPKIAILCYYLLAMLWFIPDKRIEDALSKKKGE